MDRAPYIQDAINRLVIILSGLLLTYLISQYDNLLELFSLGVQEPGFTSHMSTLLIYMLFFKTIHGLLIVIYDKEYEEQVLSNIQTEKTLLMRIQLILQITLIAFVLVCSYIILQYLAEYLGGQVAKCGFSHLPNEEQNSAKSRFFFKTYVGMLALVFVYSLWDYASLCFCDQRPFPQRQTFTSGVNFSWGNPNTKYPQFFSAWLTIDIIALSIVLLLVGVLKLQSIDFGYAVHNEEVKPLLIITDSNYRALTIGILLIFVSLDYYLNRDFYFPVLKRNTESTKSLDPSPSKSGG